MRTVPVHYQNMKLVTQDTNISCGIAALAMICGTTMQEMKANLKEERCGPVEWRRWLEPYGVTLEMREHTDWESLWLLIVPSPNKYGQIHVVVLDCRPCRDGLEPRWYDPQMGNEQSMHWTYDDWIKTRVTHSVAYRVIKDTYGRVVQECFFCTSKAMPTFLRSVEFKEGRITVWACDACYKEQTCAR